MTFSRRELSGLMILTALVFGCESRYQLRAFADLQLISRAVEKEKAEDNRVSRESVEGAIRTVVGQNGRDIWGNQIIYLVREQDWVLISPGADGQLDFETTDMYFSMTPEDIRGKPDRDIVFRNGRQLTYAGK